jgi:hypothetical protein
MRLTAFVAAMAVLVVPLALTSARAQQLQGMGWSAPIQLGSDADPYWGKQDGYICRRWCLDDRNPCDPVQFKVADGRCFGDYRSFYGVLNCRLDHDNRPECPTHSSGR